MPKKPDPPRPDDNPPAAGPSFEEALGSLEEIVHELEEGQLGLNEAMGRYERGVKLLRTCYDMLEGAQRRIELLTGVDPAGNPVTQPFDDPSTANLEEKAGSRSRRRTAARGGEPSAGPESPSEERDMDGPQGPG